mmetsp:Transcript_57404/g.171225  ORF Transcript_57404/g.171225 Transcript_57404/m.171225 type:complete len:257 (-) Transcript_57404:1639-2409(-)
MLLREAMASFLAAPILLSSLLFTASIANAMPADWSQVLRAPCHRTPFVRTSSSALALAVPFSPHVTGASYLAISATVTYLGLAAALDAPGGSMAVDKSCFEVRQSQVKGGGLGLFTTVDMKEGTKLGTYPGVVRSAASYMKKFRRYPNTCTYAWRFKDSLGYIDPTDSFGRIQNFCQGGSSDTVGSVFLHENLLGRGVPTLLARINEPPSARGNRGCNVITREDLKERTVPFFLSRDVVAGEELFLDYGGVAIVRR